MNRWIAALSCVVLNACGGARSTPSAGTTNTRDGVYEFSASFPAYEPGKTIHVQGTLTILGDSLSVQSPNGCMTAVEYGRVVPRGMPSTTTQRTFVCAGAWLSFAGSDPVKSATWYATVPVPKQRNTCAEYRVNDARSGRRECVRYRPETYYEYQTRSGGIQVRLIQ